MQKKKKDKIRFITFLMSFAIILIACFLPFTKINSAFAASSSGSSRYTLQDVNSSIISYLPCKYVNNYQFLLTNADFSSVLTMKSSSSSSDSYVTFSSTFKYSFDDYYDSISLNSTEKTRVETILRQYLSYFETAPFIRSLVIPLYLYSSNNTLFYINDSWGNSLISVTTGSLSIRVTSFSNNYPYISFYYPSGTPQSVSCFFNIGLYCSVNNLHLYDVINDLTIQFTGGIAQSDKAANFYYLPALLGVQSGLSSDSFGYLINSNRSYENASAFTRFQSILNFDDLRFDIDDDSANYNAGYMAGKNDAILQNQSAVESARQSGYNNGYDVGEQVGYQDGYTAGSGAGANLGNVIFSFASLPTGILSNMFNFNLFGFNIYAVLLAFITLVIGIWIIKKVK